MSDPYIPDKVIAKMKKLEIFEADILDVFYHGEYKKFYSGMSVAFKKYSGYEIGVGYAVNDKTSGYIITTVWKRERR